jgi:coenzyme F420-reducing hydrogenase delta subunit
MQLKLNEMKKRYMAYVDEELDKLSDEEDRLRFLQEYISEKSEFYKIYNDDLIKKADDADKLKTYLKRLIADLYWLFTQRDKIIEEDFDI